MANRLLPESQIRKMITIRLYPHQIQALKELAGQYNTSLQMLIEIMVNALNERSKPAEKILEAWYKKQQELAALKGKAATYLDEVEKASLLDIIESSEPND